ncbi:prephenate dehydratase [Planosporangium mesophilum]|uniref:Prephenate dehydratase n=1 Tax=Planosporangium mesophilum TaxID=689768 RepID=A0A8J3X2G9_9ACTN|nr:prephenate dehydratase [Planosporangium mesophilum]NJC82351.1 prephenate dehydratase [Planosporangium mesophilum]GII24906.1 prephenate dehydratase [Planosporangium mesophilum]
MPGVPSTRFVYLGPEGTFTEQALRTIPAAERGTRTPARSVPEALDAVRAGDADAALVPLENSIGGQVGVTLDELADGAPLVITREVVIPVQFVLGARAELALDGIRSIAAHPQASAQCRRWLQAHVPSATVVDALSNGAAAQAAAAGEYDAAICAPIGAGRERLAVLAKDIADHPDAVTRFALVSRPGPPPQPTGNDLTTLAVYIAHDRVGALLAVLTELAVRGVNLTRIESRPTGERLGRYVFFLDCSGHVAEVRMGEALQGLRRVCAEVRFLGSYPRAGADRPAPTPPGASDADFADAAAWLARIRAGEPS